MRSSALAIALLLAGISPALAQSPPPVVEAQSVQAQVEAILATAPAGTRWGLLVVDAEGREVVAVDPDHRFIPASNTKLFTTAAAYAMLPRINEPDAQHGTSVALVPARSPNPEPSIYGIGPDDPLPAGGVDVHLIGRGDVRVSSASDCITDCLARLADAVASRTHRVRDVVGDSRFWPDQRWSQGMSWNNIVTDDGTALSALNLDDNRLVLEVTANPGQQPRTSMQSYFSIRNEAATVPANQSNSLRLVRDVNATEIRLLGQLPANASPWRIELGLDDPAHYAATVLKDMLEARGVRVTGRVRSLNRPAIHDDFPNGRERLDWTFTDSGPISFAYLTPPPLSEDIVTINKWSNNLHAQALLRRIGDEIGTGSEEWGLVAMRQILERAGIPRAGYDFSDGSGMSTYNRVSPRAGVALLRWTQTQPWGAEWRASLPIGGVDGTLRRRFAGTPLQGRIWAKTGTLNATNALSGYLTAASGRELIFSFFANDVPDGGNAVPAMDAALLAIAAAN